MKEKFKNLPEVLQWQIISRFAGGAGFFLSLTKELLQNTSLLQVRMLTTWLSMIAIRAALWPVFTIKVQKHLKTTF